MGETIHPRPCLVLSHRVSQLATEVHEEFCPPCTVPSVAWPIILWLSMWTEHWWTLLILGKTEKQTTSCSCPVVFTGVEALSWIEPTSCSVGRVGKSLPCWRWRLYVMFPVTTACDVFYLFGFDLGFGLVWFGWDKVSCSSGFRLAVHSRMTWNLEH